MKIIRTDSNSILFQQLVNELDADLRSRYNELQDTYSQYNKVPNLPTVVIAMVGDVPAGCGCFKPFDENSIEIKRMYVAPAQRRCGVAAAILGELQRWAKELGYSKAVLETGTLQHEAIAFYQKNGFGITVNYGQYTGMETSICMKREIV